MPHIPEGFKLLGVICYHIMNRISKKRKYWMHSLCVIFWNTLKNLRLLPLNPTNFWRFNKMFSNCIVNTVICCVNEILHTQQFHQLSLQEYSSPPWQPLPQKTGKLSPVDPIGLILRQASIDDGAARCLLTRPTKKALGILLTAISFRFGLRYREIAWLHALLSGVPGVGASRKRFGCVRSEPTVY